MNILQMTQNANTDPSLPAEDGANYIPLEKVRYSLALIWLCGCGVIVLIVVVQSLLGHFQDESQAVWGWLLPTIMPSLSMIMTVLGYTALVESSAKLAVRISFLLLVKWLSLFYLALVLITIIIQPFTSSSPTELMSLSNLWLGPIQALVASALGVLFVSKRPSSI
jgi:hypothetical protein